MPEIRDILLEMAELAGAFDLTEARQKKVAKDPKPKAPKAKTKAKAKMPGRPGSARDTSGGFVPEPKAVTSPHKHAFDTLMKRKVDAHKDQARKFHTAKKRKEAAYIAQHTKEMSKTAKTAWIRKNFPDHLKKVDTIVNKGAREAFPFHGKRIKNIYKTKKLGDKYTKQIDRKQARNEKRRPSTHHTFLHPPGSGHPDEKRTVTTARVRDTQGGFSRAHNPFKRRPTIGKTDFNAGNRGPRSVSRKSEWSCRKIGFYKQACTKLRDPKRKERLKKLQALSKSGQISKAEAQARRAKIKKGTRMMVNINREYKLNYDKKYKQFEKRKRHSAQGKSDEVGDASKHPTMSAHMKHDGSNKHIGKPYTHAGHK